MRCLVLPSTALAVAAGCVEVAPPTCDDLDGDGWSCETSALGDCDERRDDVHPAAVEVCENDVDEDCSGLDLPCTQEIQPLYKSLETNGDVGGTNGEVDPQPFSFEFTGQLGWTMTGVHRSSQHLYSGVGSPERFAGVLLGPDVTTYEATATRDDVVTGRAYMQVVVAWSRPPLAHGQTTYGFLPDGSVRRHDWLIVDQPGATSLSTYASFDTNTIDWVDWSANQTSAYQTQSLADPEILYQGSESSLGWLCGVSESSMIGLTWRPLSGPGGPRITIGGDGDTRVSFEYDLVPGDVPPARYEHMTLLQVDENYMVGAAACEQLDEVALAFQLPAPLERLRGEIGTGDMNGDGFVEEEGIFEVHRAGEPYVEVSFGGTGEIPPRFALRIERPGSSGMTVWLDGERLLVGRDYLIQGSDFTFADDYLVIYLPRRLDPGQVLRVATPGGEP